MVASCLMHCSWDGCGAVYNANCSLQYWQELSFLYPSILEYVESNTDTVFVLLFLFFFFIFFFIFVFSP